MNMEARQLETEFETRSLRTKPILERLMRPLCIRLGLATLVSAAGLQPIWASSAAPALSQIDPGPIAISTTLEPAEFGFDTPSGKIESATESAANAVAAVLKTPRLGNPQLEAALGVVEFSVSPFVAGYAALQGSHRYLPPEKLAEAEQDLTYELARVANQEEFRRMVLEEARARTHRALLDLSLENGISGAQPPFSALLETRVEDLRLHRSSRNNARFKLIINVRVQLIRVVGNSVVYDRHFRYESGEEMFIEWTRQDGLASVARTGLAELARRLTGEVFAIPLEAPIAIRPEQSPRLANHPVRHLRSGTQQVRTEAPSTWQDAQMRFADLHSSDSLSLEVLPGFSAQQLRIVGPVEPQSPSSSVETDTEYALDGLENHPNFVVQAAACVGAIPFGLWEHTVGAFSASRDEVLQAADGIIRTQRQHQPPEEKLVVEIAQQLGTQTSLPVACSTRAGLAAERSLNSSGLESAQPAVDRPASHPPDLRLEVRVVKLELTGKRARNPQVRLCLELEATLIRVCDGQEVCAWPVSYNSPVHRLPAWAANDALLYQRELNLAYSQISARLAEELVTTGFFQPKREAPSTLATN